MKIRLLVLLCFTAISANAGHIAGAHMSYECLNIQNQYSIRLTAYRDCNGLSFDIDLDVAIYDSLNNLVMELDLQRGTPVTIPRELTTHPCALAPPSLCVQKVVYSAPVFLPPIAGGYTISWQRCCRNANIQNINGAQNYGTTATIQIPSMDTLCNSSPHFASTVPNVMCLNEEVDFSLDVVDPDGDSLVYVMCELFAGGGGTAGAFGCTTTASVPDPACPPPYVTIVYNGTNTTNNPIPSVVPISLDSLTGRITGVPDQFGTYAVGMCVKEYRDGKLLSTLRLDYQFNVVSCVYTGADMISEIEAPERLCHGLTVDFTSESVHANNLFWNFGDTTVLSDTSNLVSPTYTFPSEGKYLVKHVAIGFDPICNDTVYELFNVRNEVFPEFNFIGPDCFDRHAITFEAIGDYPSDVTFKWEFGDDANHPMHNTRFPPIIQWSIPGVFPVVLRVDYGVCYNEYFDTIEIFDFNVGAGVGPDQTIHRGGTVTLTAFGGVDYYWYADKPVEIGSRFSAQTKARMDYGSDSVYFYVKIKNKFGCEKLDSILVVITDNDIDEVINFFTPNEDGLNDYFDLSNINPDGCAIEIMNRWGKSVWSDNEYDNDWTGKDRGGNPLPDGTYYYILSCDEIVRYKSAVTLIRNN